MSQYGHLRYRIVALESKKIPTRHESPVVIPYNALSNKTQCDERDLYGKAQDRLSSGHCNLQCIREYHLLLVMLD